MPAVGKHKLNGGSLISSKRKSSSRHFSIAGSVGQRRALLLKNLAGKSREHGGKK